MHPSPPGGQEVSRAAAGGALPILDPVAAGWDVVGTSRRKPELPSGRDIECLLVDLHDEAAARAAFEKLTDITHIAYMAIYEKPELVAGWSDRHQIGTNNAMLRNVVERIVRSASDLKHVSLLQGTKAGRCGPASLPGNCR